MSGSTSEQDLGRYPRLRRFLEYWGRVYLFVFLLGPMLATVVVLLSIVALTTVQRGRGTVGLHVNV